MLWGKGWMFSVVVWRSGEELGSWNEREVETDKGRSGDGDKGFVWMD